MVGEFPQISLPPALHAGLGDRARSWLRADVADPVRLEERLAPLVASAVIGPAFIGYSSRATFAEALAANVRPLTLADQAEVAQFRAHCDPVEWEHGGSPLGGVPTFGAFDGRGELAAMAGYEVWGERIAHISVVTAPARRARGHGGHAVAQAAEHALRAGLLPQYRTLLSNRPSMRLAERLGFECYGFSVYVKLAGPQPV